MDIPSSSPLDVAAARRLALVLTSSDWMAGEVAVRAVRLAEATRDEDGPARAFRVRVLLHVPGQVAELRHALGLSASDADAPTPTEGMFDRWSEMYFRLTAAEQAALWHHYVEEEDDDTAAASIGIDPAALTPLLARAEAALCARFLGQADSAALPGLTTVVMRRAVVAVVGARVSTFYCPALFGQDTPSPAAPSGGWTSAVDRTPGAVASRSPHVGARPAALATALACVALAGATAAMWPREAVPDAPIATPTAVTTASPRLSLTNGVLQPGNLDVLSTAAPAPPTTVTTRAPAPAAPAVEPLTLDGTPSPGGTVGLRVELGNVGEVPLHDLVVHVEVRDAAPEGQPRLPDGWRCAVTETGFRCDVAAVAAGSVDRLVLPLRIGESVEAVVVIGRVWSDGRLHTTLYSTFTTVRRPSTSPAPTTPRPTTTHTAPITTSPVTTVSRSTSTTGSP